MEWRLGNTNKDEKTIFPQCGISLRLKPEKQITAWLFTRLPAIKNAVRFETNVKHSFVVGYETNLL